MTMTLLSGSQMEYTRASDTAQWGYMHTTERSHLYSQMNLDRIWSVVSSLTDDFQITSLCTYIYILKITWET